MRLYGERNTSVSQNRVQWHYRPYKNEWDDDHGHVVEMRGGNARIETGEILEW